MYHLGNSDAKSNQDSQYDQNVWFALSHLIPLCPSYAVDFIIRESANIHKNIGGFIIFVTKFLHSRTEATYLAEK